MESFLSACGDLPFHGRKGEELPALTLQTALRLRGKTHRGTNQCDSYPGAGLLCVPLFGTEVFSLLLAGSRVDDAQEAYIRDVVQIDGAEELRLTAPLLRELQQEELRKVVQEGTRTPLVEVGHQHHI